MHHLLKQNIVIFDGPDRCGKTNMAQALSRRINVPYFKNRDEHKYFLSDPSYFLHAIRYVDTYFASYLEASGASVILDRAWPSEWVYSQTFNRPTDMELLRELDNRHAKLGTKIIIPLRKDYSRVRDEYDSINQKLTTLHDFYLKFHEWSNTQTKIIWVDDEDLDREMQEITKFINFG